MLVMLVIERVLRVMPVRVLLPWKGSRPVLEFVSHQGLHCDVEEAGIVERSAKKCGQ